MKITMYELLGMVKDGKAPKKVKYDDRIYTFNDKKDNYYENETCSINWDYVAIYCLNEEVEIIEEEICHKCHKYPAEHYTRKRAISTIVIKRLQQYQKQIRNQLEKLTNEELEVLLKECIRDKSKNYFVKY